MNMLKTMVVSGSLVLLSLPLVHALGTLMKMQPKKLYPILRLMVVSEVVTPVSTARVSSESGEGQAPTVR